MAQILVVNEGHCWYQAVGALDNYYEKDIEDRILKHAVGVFNGYYAFKCKFTFSNRAGETSDPDILLISKDFTRWLIVEVEMTSKSLSHTKMQLRVFTKPKFDINQLVQYCINNCQQLNGMADRLTQLFTNKAADVLVVFDSYHKTKLKTLQDEFKGIKICVFEVYKTSGHDFETYRLSGDYPYVYSGYTFLKCSATSFDIYEVERPELMNGINTGTFDVLYKMAKYKSHLMSTRSKYYLKIPNNPFNPGTVLMIYRTIDNTFFIDTVN